MALLRITSPHAHGPMSTQRVMQNVLLATIPGIIVLTHFFGFGTLVNILWGCLGGPGLRVAGAEAYAGVPWAST